MYVTECCNNYAELVHAECGEYYVCSRCGRPAVLYHPNEGEVVC